MFPSQTTINNLSTPNQGNDFFLDNNCLIDQLLRKISFVEMTASNNSYEFNRASAIPALNFSRKTDTVPNNATDVTKTSISFSRIGDCLEMDNFDELASRCVDQLEQQVRATKFAILRALSYQVINGTGSAPNLSGFVKQVMTKVGANSNNTNGGFLSLRDLYLAKYTCTPSDNGIGSGADCWIGNSKALREVLGLIDNSSSQCVEWECDPDLGVRVPIICGMPFYVCESILNNETKGTGTGLTSIYITKLCGNTAVQILYAKDPEIECDEWGISTIDLPNQSRYDKILKSVFAYYSVFVPESKYNLICLDGIKASQFA